MTRSDSQALETKLRLQTMGNDFDVANLFGLDSRVQFVVQ